MGRTYERTYEAPHYRVWDALMATITDLGYLDVVPNLPAGNIAYRTGPSMSTWRGQQMAAVVRDQGGSTLVSLSGRAAGSQLVSWGETTRLANKVLNRLDQRMAG
jgi:hypothetical protein